MTSKPQDPWEAATFEGARRAQIRRMRDLTPHQRLEAMIDLEETAATLASSEREQASPSGALTGEAGIGERGAGYRTPATEGIQRVVLEGCSPTPLSAYLKALGILRLVTEQADPDARGYWENDGFVLETSLGAEGLRRFFLHDYSPTPVLAPWNGGSGFYPKDNKDGIEPLRSTAAPRFAVLRATIACIERMLEAAGYTERPADEEKTHFLASLRANLPEKALAWLDAAVLLTEDSPRYPPLLGTGGNDGRLDFTNNFMQRLIAAFEPQTGEPRASARAWLDQAVFATPCPAMPHAKIGQFSPGDAGGPNQTTGFEANKPLVNPWDFILMLEGALLFAAAATKRLESAQGASLSYPFTVRPTGAGNGALSLDEENNARAEFWAPMWSTSVHLCELQAILAEGRVTLGRRSARDGLDFARAVSRLGVERGIGSFQRYAFLMRSGKAFFATPLDRITVQRNRGADLIDELDMSGWLGRVRYHARKEGADRVVSLARRLEDDLFTLAGAQDDHAPVIRRLLSDLGDIQLYLARSPKARDIAAGGCPPVPSLSPQWFQRADDGSAEMAIAAGLASLHARSSKGEPRLPMRVHLAPENHGRYPAWLDEDSRSVTWSAGAELADNLANTLHRRLLDAEQNDDADKPLASWRNVALADVAAWLAGGVDERRVRSLLPGLMLARIPAGPDHRSERDAPIPLAYRLLKPLFCTDRQLQRIGLLPADRSMALTADVVRRLEADDVAGAMTLARRRLRGAGVLRAGGSFGAGTSSGRRLLAALLVPIADHDLYLLTKPLKPSIDEPDQPAETSAHD